MCNTCTAGSASLTRAGAEAIIRCGDIRSEFATLLTTARKKRERIHCAKKRESEFATSAPARVKVQLPIISLESAGLGDQIVMIKIWSIQ